MTAVSAFAAFGGGALLRLGMHLTVRRANKERQLLECLRGNVDSNVNSFDSNVLNEEAAFFAAIVDDPQAIAVAVSWLGIPVEILAVFGR